MTEILDNILLRLFDTQDLPLSLEEREVEPCQSKCLLALWYPQRWRTRLCSVAPDL